MWYRFLLIDQSAAVKSRYVHSHSDSFLSIVLPDDGKQAKRFIFGIHLDLNQNKEGADIVI